MGRVNNYSTTEWKIKNNLKNVNFFIPITLLNELDWWKNHYGMSRSEIIRSGIRLYIKHKKEQLASFEKQELENYYISRKNNSINTGLLPDY